MSFDFAGLGERHEALNKRVETALHDALRNHSGLTMVAVSKRQPLAAVKAAHKLGVRHFGENQIQEALPKVAASPEDIVWHFIGHLQRNKVRKAVTHFSYLHSVDSLSLLQRIDQIAHQERVCPKVFLQVNLAHDPDKHGLHPDGVQAVLEAAIGMHSVDCVGLMGIPPLEADPNKTAAFYKNLAEMRNRLQESFSDWPGLLSMGMSSDLEAAINAGSHFIRVGTGLFGARTW